MKPRWFILSAVLLLLAGCEDSNVALSDPETSKADERLIGLWRSNEDYYHIGLAGEKFPKGVMRVVWITHDRKIVCSANEFLIFPTILGEDHCLSVVMIDPEQTMRVYNEGWKAVAFDTFTFFKYQVDGDKIVAWAIDGDAKEQAIKDNKIKGVIEEDAPGKFTDTTENLVRFITDAGDSLWDREPVMQLERVEIAKKP
jgi:hypothetical protein